MEHFPLVHAPHYEFSNWIMNKQRLKWITINDTGNANGYVTKWLEFRYRANDAVCPGLLNSVVSFGENRIHRVRYVYENLHNTVNDNKIGTPMSKCLLHKVEDDPANNSDTERWFTKWTFEYGLKIKNDPISYAYYYKAVGSSTSNIKYDWNTRTHAYNLVPLKSVVVPTGASVNYEYDRLHICLYQPVNGYVQTNESVCNDDKPKRLAMSLRSVTSPSTANTAFNYLTNISYTTSDDGYVRRTIENGSGISKHKYVLDFNPILRGGTQSYPGGDDPELDEALRDNGKLVSHSLLDRFDNVQSVTTYTYLENETFHSGKSSPTRNDHPEMKSGTATTPKWYRNRKLYRFDHRRNNQSTVVVSRNGRSYGTEYKQYDKYNNPGLVIDTAGASGGTAELTRTKLLAYDNSQNSRPIWFIGHLVSEQTSSGGDGLHKNVYNYNDMGLLDAKNEAGINSSFGYNDQGLLAWAKDGNGKRTDFDNYVEGVPTLITYPDGGEVTRTVDGVGNITSETERLDGSQSITRSYEYNELYKRKSKDIGYGNAADVTYTYPTWERDGTSLDTRRKQSYIAGQSNTFELYDTLGRVHQRTEIEYSNLKFIHKNTTYESAFGLVEKQTPAIGTLSTNEGSRFSYDNFGRVISIVNVLTGAIKRICYGQGCDTHGFYSIPGAGFDEGYAVREPDGNVTQYNMRQIGAHAQPEIMAIHRKVSPPSHYKDSDTTQSTLIERNDVGFVSSITQGNSGTRSLQRTFTPQSRGGSTSLRVHSETHPEFGTRTVMAVDGNANPTMVKNFDGANI